MKTTHQPIITPAGKISNPRALDISFVAPASGATCSRCDRPASPYTTPPLCDLHLDLVLLLAHMQKKDVPITLHNACQFLQAAVARGGEWTLTPAELPGLFNDLLEA